MLPYLYLYDKLQHGVWGEFLLLEVRLGECLVLQMGDVQGGTSRCVVCRHTRYRLLQLRVQGKVYKWVKSSLVIIIMWQLRNKD